MRLQKKSISRLNLLDLLRKKRSNLTSYLSENGIASYELLASRCNSIGVAPPTEEEFLNAKGNPVTPEFSSPTEGIVVLNPEPLAEQAEQITHANVVLEENSLEETSDIPKLPRKKKKNSDQ